jgi:tetratricopeptide (TPR) repeat protein
MAEENSEFLAKTKQVMDEAIDKAGDLLMSRPQVAEIILKQLLKCDPEHPAGLQLLGLCKHRMGENIEAVEIIQTAIEVDPENGDNYNNLGLAYSGLQQFDRAI